MVNHARSAAARARAGRLAFVIAAAAGAIPVRAQSATDQQMIHTDTLENGLDVIVVKNPTIPFATVQMVFRAGAFTQLGPAEEGLPHLVEHMLFRQGDEGGESSFQRETSRIEAGTNGVTSAETVRYYLIFPSRHLEKGMELVSDLVRKPDFSRAALDAERPVVRGELQRRAAEPQLLLRVESDRALWSDAGWARKNPGGNLIAIGNATPERLNALYKQFYVPNNAALIVAGDVSETRVFELARKIFRGWRRGADPLVDLPPPVIPPLTAIRRGMVTAEVKDVTFLVRWQGPSVGKDRASTYAAEIFAGLVNQPLSGTQRRLIDGGHFESVSLSYDTKNYVGPIELYATTSPEKAVAAAAALGAELSKLVTSDYFDAEDLVLAKKRQRVYWEFQLESASSFSHALAEIWSSAGLDYYMDYARNLDAQTADDVHRFVQTYITGKPMSVHVLLSSTSRQMVGNGLNGALAAWKVP